mgnify:FL=1
MSTWNKHYHWKTKGCTPWAKEWFTDNIVGKSVSVGSQAVKVDKLTGFDGDVELGNRKGKLITIYECDMTFTWSGETEDGKTVSGTIKFPEVSHENEDNDEDYRFETELNSESSDDARALYEAVRSRLVPQVVEQFHRFPRELIDAHAKDLGHEGKGPAPVERDAPVAVAAAPAPAARSAPQKVSTSTASVHVSANLAVSQADLWDLLTNPLRIPMWSRAPAQFSSNKGANFSLFGGNISGSIVEVSQPNKLVQSWRVPQWPANHYGTLTTELTQGDDSTKLQLTLTGVPTSEEENAHSGLENYYIRGLKSIGLGTML